MTKKERESRIHLKWKVFEDEGLDYTIRWSGVGDDIKDPEFKRLELTYCTAAAELEQWIKENCPDGDPEE